MTIRGALAGVSIAGLLLTVGCVGTDDVARDRSTQAPAQTPGQTRTSIEGEGDGDGGYDVRLFHATAAGGRVDRTLRQVQEVADVERVIATVRGPELRTRVTAAVRDLLEQQRSVYLAVITVGCDVPPGALVRPGDDGELVIVPGKVPDPKQECFAPVVTVAVVSTTD